MKDENAVITAGSWYDNTVRLHMYNTAETSSCLYVCAEIRIDY